MNYNEAISLDNSQTNARRKIGDILFRDEKYLEAIKYYKDVQDHLKIEDCFEQLIKEHPKNAQIRMQKAEYYREFGMLDFALKSYYQAITLFSYDQK